MNPESRRTLCEGGKAQQVARRIPPYRPSIVAHGFAWRPFTPPYPKGGA
jgi:hypothetical protein